jgi:LPS-assembly protein
MAGLPSARPPTRRPQCRGVASIVVAVLSLLLCGGLIAATPAAAQLLTFPAPAPSPPKSQIAIDREKSGDKQMLVQAREIDYDYTNHRVSAVGGVQIYYGGATIEADRVIYDQTTKRLHAEGNVRLSEPDGKVTYGQIMDLADDYRDGFVDSLRLDTPDQTRMAAARAERSSGNYTVFHNGVYTACLPCKDDPKKPPLWQVKAVRMIHDQGEKMIYFEDASLEFFGMPIAWMPYFSAPDPTVKRKTGFLIPIAGYSSLFGASLEIPYYWALAPDYDATFQPRITSTQGVLLQGEFRQRTLNGAYSVSAAGIRQLNKQKFDVGAPGYLDWRGAVQTQGQFAINTQWVWGWTGVAVSDRQFLADYRPGLLRYLNPADPLQPSITEGVSQLYLAGKGNRSYFDARSIYYYGFSTADTQAQIPIVHPVIDYNLTLDHPVLGGELGYKLNFTSLSRQSANFDAITSAAIGSGACAPTADPRQILPASCLLRGVPGTYNRFSAEMDWRRSFTDSYGQIFTPFASARVDTAAMSINPDPGVSNYIQTGDSQVVRAMPTVGMEYRYPFINAQSWGTQTIEPIGQVIIRPNETKIGSMPNEDAQSLTFDDSNLFRVDKFSGWDRVEGGSRANAGVQYTAQFNKAGYVNALVGQSYQLFGQNSFTQGGGTNTGLNSGLDTAQSDYVTRVSFQPNSTYKFTQRFRLDHNNYSIQRNEIEATATFSRWNFTAMYGDYAAQPDLGFLYRRKGVLGSAVLKLDANWVLSGSLRYDLTAKKINQTLIGLGYVDDCFILGLNYITNYNYDTLGSPTLVHQVMLQLSLRTIGDGITTTNLSQQQ